MLNIQSPFWDRLRRRIFKPETMRLDSKYFPESTKDVIPIKTLLQHGALVLGQREARGLYRGKILNLGFLDPFDRVARVEVENLVRAKFPQLSGIHVYQITSSDFVDIVRKIYGIDVSQEYPSLNKAKTTPPSP